MLSTKRFLTSFGKLSKFVSILG